MKRGTKAALIIAFVVAFYAKLVWDAGLFYRVARHGFESCRTIATVPGPEDMAFSRTLGLLIISSDPRPELGQKSEANGQLYGLDQAGKIHALAEGLPGIFHPHGLDVLDLGQRARVFVVNHREHDSVVELFESAGIALHHIRTFADPGLTTPNDVVATGPESFYVTQDHGSPSRFLQNLEHFTRVGFGSVAYAENGKFTTVLTGLSFANGIARDQERSLLYVATTLEKAVRVYHIGKSPLDLELVRRIHLPAGPDNLSLAKDGSLWIGSHPNIFALKRHSERHASRAPSMILRLERPWADDPVVHEVMADDGSVLAAASVALPLSGKLYLGSIYDPKVLECAEPRPALSAAPFL